MEGVFITIDFNDVKDKNDLPVNGVFDFIDRVVNYNYNRVVIFISDITKKKQIEDWLIEQHSPMLIHIQIQAVIVTNVIPQSLLYISSRALRFINWADEERYLL